MWVGSWRFSSSKGVAVKAWLNLPNALTFSRIAVVPLVFALWGNGYFLLATICAGLAALTDFFDGRIARATNQVTMTGAILDPVADKVMVTSLFGLLTYEGVMPGWLLAVAVLRNVSQLLSIPILMWWKKINFKVRPAFIPKFASAFAFVLVIAGFAVAVPGEKSALVHVVQSVLPAAYLVQGVLELQILVTYVPSFFFQILKGSHDTFE